MFSNFSAFAIEWRGRVWMTTEHAYQAAKFDDEEIVNQIYKARSPYEAKKIAHINENKKRETWQEEKLGIMEEIVKAKIEQHEYVKAKLLETGTSEIVEDSPVDAYWGHGPDKLGENHLGKIWMKLRGDIVL